MLTIETFTVNPLCENCYVASDETGECLVVDCGAYSRRERTAVVEYIKGNGLVPKHHILTHAHIDHCIGSDSIFEEFGLPPAVHLSDEPLVKGMDQMCRYVFGEPLPKSLPADWKYFTERDTVFFGNHKFAVLPTPGHSPGSVFFYCEEEKAAFSGDTLFKGSIGRTDLTGGSMFLIIQSLRMICQLDDDVKIYPGHGEATTIGYECAANPFIDR